MNPSHKNKGPIYYLNPREPTRNSVDLFGTAERLYYITGIPIEVMIASVLSRLDSAEVVMLNSALGLPIEPCLSLAGKSSSFVESYVSLWGEELYETHPGLLIDIVKRRDVHLFTCFRQKFLLEETIEEMILSTVLCIDYLSSQDALSIIDLAWFDAQCRLLGWTPPKLYLYPWEEQFVFRALAREDSYERMVTLNYYADVSYGEGWNLYACSEFINCYRFVQCRCFSICRCTDEVNYLHPRSDLPAAIPYLLSWIEEYERQSWRPDNAIAAAVELRAELLHENYPPY